MDRLDALDLRGPADPDQIARLRREVGRQVPEDYLAFLAVHDGGTGPVGRLNPAAEVGSSAEFHPEHDHLQDLVVFGSDGAAEAFAFDRDGHVVVVPWIGGPEDAIPQGTFRDQFPGQVATIREHRKRLRGDEPIEIAANSHWLYLGKPAFEMPAGSVTGSADAIAASLRELRAMGASMCGVRFRSRSCDELCDQIDAFGREVAPLLD